MVSPVDVAVAGVVAAAIILDDDDDTTQNPAEWISGPVIATYTEGGKTFQIEAQKGKRGTTSQDLFRMKIKGEDRFPDPTKPGNLLFRSSNYSYRTLDEITEAAQLWVTSIPQPEPQPEPEPGPLPPGPSLPPTGPVNPGSGGLANPDDFTVDMSIPAQNLDVSPSQVIGGSNYGGMDTLSNIGPSMDVTQNSEVFEETHMGQSFVDIVEDGYTSPFSTFDTDAPLLIDNRTPKGFYAISSPTQQAILADDSDFASQNSGNLFYIQIAKDTSATIKLEVIGFPQKGSDLTETWTLVMQPNDTLLVRLPLGRENKAALKATIRGEQALEYTPDVMGYAELAGARITLLSARFVGEREDDYTIPQDDKENVPSPSPNTPPTEDDDGSDGGDGGGTVTTQNSGLSGAAILGLIGLGGFLIYILFFRPGGGESNGSE